MPKTIYCPECHQPCNRVYRPEWGVYCSDCCEGPLHYLCGHCGGTGEEKENPGVECEHCGGMGFRFPEGTFADEYELKIEDFI